MLPRLSTLPATMSVAVSLSLSAWSASAEVPSVVTDVPPIHGLVSAVMGDLGAPDLLVPPGTSPHGYAMRPSEARALQNADLVFWVGHALTPWLEGPVEEIATSATSIELLDVDGILLRESTDDHDHHHGHGHGEEEHAEHEEHGDEEHADHDDHDHDKHGAEEHAEHDDHDHDKQGEEEHAEHDDHDHDKHGDEEHAEHDDHDHDKHGDEEHAEHEDHDDHGDEEHADGEFRVDPHAWLDPDNAIAWLDTIADALSEADPDNAATYAANAAEAAAAINIEVGKITQTFAEREPLPVVVFHDAYAYFQGKFDLPRPLTISDSEATTPGAARLVEIREDIAGLGAQCIFAEPQYPEQAVKTLVDETGLEQRILDPLGSDIEPGAGYYPALMQAMAEAFSTCG